MIIIRRIEERAIVLVKESRGRIILEVYILLAVLYFPFFIWLSLTYIKYSKDAIGDSKRKNIYMGFSLTISLFNFLNNILFELEDSVGLFYNQN